MNYMLEETSKIFIVKMAMDLEKMTKWIDE